MNIARKKKRHYTIPIFIPMEACPFHCIFCDQEKISGRGKVPSIEDVVSTIKEHLATIQQPSTEIEAGNPQTCAEIEVGFFGGTFTGLPPEQQINYLDAVLPFVNNGRISGIRLSTRPDFITNDVLALLKRYPVKTIELGAQSMDDEVLRISGRGHTAADTENASRMILEAGVKLGLQMMIGLPGDTEDKSVRTAQRIIELGASETRIYPVIVIKGTPLEDLYYKGNYVPLELEEAVEISKKIVKVFDASDVTIIRIGLHPSEGLLNRNDYIAGPFHTSFRELVMTSLWTERFHDLLKEDNGDSVEIHVNPADLHPAIGYYGKNRKLLESRFRKVKFISDQTIEEDTFHADAGC